MTNRERAIEKILSFLLPQDASPEAKERFRLLILEGRLDERLIEVEFQDRELRMTIKELIDYFIWD